ncbi:hypothetical protein BPAE_0032g00750 [Botrytis paeoniae]|uniref:Protein kinase domain-containing protein n=1 Tax=Botrytis paeoniae TaxID=278948 RepID=A0A4Z1FYL6_9HELO|nr:hypothetical protein BPAE_0032g00750 [Botrytis paeoniae]
MDVFGTTITAGTLIIQFLGAWSSFSLEAKSLKARLAWDLRVLKVVKEYFETRRLNNENQSLSPDDAALLEQTSEYLDSLVSKVLKSLRKLERKGLLHTTISRSIWIAKRSDLEDMEREVRKWTERFGVRVLGLPEELRIAIPAPQDTDDASSPPIIRSNNRLQNFIALNSHAKQKQAAALFLEDSDKLIGEIEAIGDVSSLPLQYGAEQRIFSSRDVSSKVLEGTPEFDRFVSEMGELAAALNCIDPATDIRLLKVVNYFYFPVRRQFLFAHIPPYKVLNMMTLDQMINYDPFPDPMTALDRCFKIAYRLAEAVFFLHTAGFLHKNITSSSVVVLRRDDPHNRLIDEAYLMGFDLIRSTEATTYKEGSSQVIDYVSRNIWDFDIFQHPDRLQKSNVPRYIKTYDVYSLGVILFEIGFWMPLSKVAKNIQMNDPSSWAQELSQLVPEMGKRVGQRYERLVAWCLGLTGDRDIKDTEFMQEVLDPLELMVNALS